MTDCKRKYRNQFVSAAYLSMAISLVLSVSCATMSEKRYVENNTFTSTYPKMAIKVSPEFKYVGEYHGGMFKQTELGSDTKSAHIKQVFYIFCQKGDDGSAKKCLVIKIAKVPERFHWLSDDFKTGTKIHSRRIKYGGMDCQFAIWPTGNLFGVTKDFVQTAGYSTKDLYLLGAIGKIVTPDSTTKMIVYYAEDLEDSGYRYSQWTKKIDLLSQSQRKFVSEFTDRFFQTAIYLSTI